MITGAHAIIFSTEAERARAFLRDVLGFDSVDAGGGWLIFALPPAELAVHPAEGEPRQELYLMTDDLEATLGALRERGVVITSEPADQGWGVLASIEVPGYGPVGLYEPRHPVPR